MKRTLSDRLLRSLAQPQTKAQEIWDQQLRGFGCRASKQGVVSFFAMRRPRGSGKSVRIKVGDFPAMPLSKARQRARALLVEMQDGVDPRARKVGIGASSSAVMVRNSTVSSNGVGIAADQAAVVRVGQSTMTANGTAWQATNGGQVQSYSNNNVVGNTTDGTVTSTVALQ